MAVSYLYPSNAELMEIERDLIPVLTNADPIFRFFPIVTREVDQLLWDQRDNYRGLQNIRGLNGDPVKVFREGSKRYRMTPGVYGDFDEVDEQELTRRSQLATFAAKPVSIDDLVREMQDRLLVREINRIKWILWTLLTTGTFSVLDVKGQTLDSGTYAVQTGVAAAGGWDQHAAATPITDLRTVQLTARGTSVKFGRGAVAFANQKTINDLLANTNQADIGRTTVVMPVISLTDVNKIMVAQDLPEFIVYDDGYVDEGGTFRLWIPDGKVVIIGQRPNGDPVGEYVETLNMNREGGGAGPYLHIVDSLTTGNPIPRKIVGHRGHNGGPTIFYPGAVYILDAS